MAAWRGLPLEVIKIERPTDLDRAELGQSNASPSWIRMMPPGAALIVRPCAHLIAAAVQHHGGLDVLGGAGGFGTASPGGRRREPASAGHGPSAAPASGVPGGATS